MAHAQALTHTTASHIRYLPLVQVDIGLLAHNVRVATTHTLDLSQGVLDLTLAVNVGVEQTQDILEVCLLVGHERCIETSKILVSLLSDSPQ